MDIAIVTYNRIDYLKKCVWSILASTPPPFRIFVIDDCSTDGTREWLVSMRDRKLIHALILNKAPSGTASNFNAVIKATDGEWIVMCNDDMYFHRGWRPACEGIAKEFADCGIVSFYNYSRLTLDEGIEHINDDVLRCVRTGLGACMIRRDLVKAVGGFYLPKGKLMGFFATNFCNRVKRCNLSRNKIYCPKPSYATHMDHPKCRLYEPNSKYEAHRLKHKHDGKFRG